MRHEAQEERILVTSLDDVPEFASEDEERYWWVTHELALELGTDGTRRHRALVQRWTAKQSEAVPQRTAIAAGATVTP